MSRVFAAAILSLLSTVPGSGPVAADDTSREGRAFERAATSDSMPDRRSELLLLGAQALFVTGRASFSEAGATAMERLLDKLDGYGEIVTIRVVGHTDDVGSRSDNRRLAERRAFAVSGTLSRRHPGVPIAVEGVGEGAPVASNATAAGRARNRRVEIHVVSVEASEGASVRNVPRDDE